jgi:hypothetical protein
MPDFIVVLSRDCQYSEQAEAIVKADSEEQAREIALQNLDPDFLHWVEQNDFSDETDIHSVSDAPEGSETSRLIGDPRSLAEEAGWTQCPNGRWWREIEQGETLPEDRVAPFLGSGPFVWADSAEDACRIDELEQS